MTLDLKELKQKRQPKKPEIINPQVDKVIWDLIQRALPYITAHEICGAQPMTGSTGLISTMRADYANTNIIDLDNSV